MSALRFLHTADWQRALSHLEDDGWQLRAVVPWLDHRVEEAANGSVQ